MVRGSRHDRLSNGRSYKMLTVLDEFTREALCVPMATKMGSEDVLEALCPLMIRRGRPTYLPADNRSEFVAETLLRWLKMLGVEPTRIFPSSPRENRCNERFSGTLRREVLRPLVANLQLPGGRWSACRLR